MPYYNQKSAINKYLKRDLKKGEKVADIKVLKRNPRGARSIVTLLYTTNKKKKYVGKVLASRKIFDKLCYILRYINHYCSAKYQIAPGILTADKSRNFVIYKFMEGRILFNEIKDGNVTIAELKKIMKNSAKALSILHSIPVTIELERLLSLRARYQITYDPNKFFRLTTFVDTTFDSQFERLKQETFYLSEKLDHEARELLDTLKVEKESLIHNDYHPEHIIFDRHYHTKIIDFDLASVGDYYWDLGRMMFKIELLGYLFYGKKITDKSISKVFFNEYLKHVDNHIHSRKVLEDIINLVRADGMRIYTLVCFKEEKEHYLDDVTYERNPEAYAKYLKFYNKYLKDLLKKIHNAVPERTKLY